MARLQPPPVNRTFFERYSVLILAVTLLCIPLILMGSRRALRSNRNDVREWLPSHFPQTAVHRWFREHFPHEQFVVVSWEDCTLDDPRLDQMVDRLREYSADSQESASPPGKSGATSARSLGHQNRSGVRGLWPFLSASRDAKPVYFKSVYSGRTLIEQFRNRFPNMSEEEISRRLEGTIIGPDHRTTCVVATLLHELHGPELKAMVATLYRIAEEIGLQPIPEPSSPWWLGRFWHGIVDFLRETVTGKRSGGPRTLHLGGPPIDNHAIDTEGQRTLYRLAALSAVVGLAMSMACLRSFRLTFFVFSLAILAAGLGLSLVYFTGQSVDAVMLSMPSLVYVLAISASIHLINYYHDAVKSQGLKGACEKAVEHGLRPCFLAALTTAFGLGSLSLSHVTPISKFGIYSALGVMTTLLLTFLVLPALLQIFPSRRLANSRSGGKTSGLEQVIDNWWRWLGGQIVRYRVIFALVSTALLVWGALGLPRIHTSVKLMKFFSEDAPIVQDYAWLEKHLGPLVPMEVILRIDNSRCSLSFVDRMRLVERVAEAVKDLPPVGGVLSAASFVPDLRPDSSPPSAFERVLGINRRRVGDDVMSKRLEAHRGALRDYLAVEGDGAIHRLELPQHLLNALNRADITTIRQLEQFAGREPIADKLIAQFGWTEADAKLVEKALRQWEAENGVELWRISARVEALSDLDYGQFVEDLRAAVEPVLAEYRDSGVEGIQAVYTGLVPLVYQVQHELFRSLFNSLMMAFVLIAGVMILLLRSVWGGLVAMIPNIFPAIVVFGAMGWFNILVDVGTMMTASVAMGVAVDDTIHFLTWFRDGLQQGLSRPNAVRYAYGRCARAMTQTSLVAGLGLAVFAFSAFTPTQRFGSLMLILLAAALVGDLIYYPALLVSPLGANFSRRRRSTPRPESDSSKMAAPLPSATMARELAEEFPIYAGCPLPDPTTKTPPGEATSHFASTCQIDQKAADVGPGNRPAVPIPLTHLLSGAHWHRLYDRIFHRS